MQSNLPTKCAALLLLSAAAQAATPIQHIVIIMQENRSFDQYFGTYPTQGIDGNYADGIPAGVCLPLSTTNPGAGCVAPYHDVHDRQDGGGHFASDAQADLDDGIASAKMDGFAARQQTGYVAACKKNPSAVMCQDHGNGIGRSDVMGYHTAQELPVYWSYAQHFVLQDRLFEGVRDWSFPSHQDLTSEWAASCKNDKDVSTCVTGGQYGGQPTTTYPWVNLFQLLDTYAVSWKWYLAEGAEPDCEDADFTCDSVKQLGNVGSIWNPAPRYASVQAQGAAYVAAHIPNIDQFLVDAKSGGAQSCNLPSVSWVVPTGNISEHPGDSGVTAGQMYVASLVNAVMLSACWNSHGDLHHLGRFRRVL